MKLSSLSALHYLILFGLLLTSLVKTGVFESRNKPVKIDLPKTERTYKLLVAKENTTNVLHSGLLFK